MLDLVPRLNRATVLENSYRQSQLAQDSGVIVVVKGFSCYYSEC